MRKKLSAIFLVVAMLSSLAGCGDSQYTRSGKITVGSSSSGTKRDADNTANPIKPTATPIVPTATPDTVDTGVIIGQPVTEDILISEPEATAQTPPIDIEPVSADYYTYMLYVSQFELLDGILTVSVDAGQLRDNILGVTAPDTISFPVSDSCIWERDSTAGFVERLVTYEEVRKDAEEWRNIYVSGDYYESPGGLGVEVKDSVIVRVYTMYP